MIRRCAAGPTELFVERIPSQIGSLLAVTDGRAVCALDFADTGERTMDRLARRFGRVVLRRRRDPLGLQARLESYFAGELRAIDGIEVNPGGTEFQRQVWRALRRIPPGRTRSYAELAARLGRPRAWRAVGHANSLNPVAIIVPCHRLVGSDAALTGYAGGVERKRWLLRHEGALGPGAWRAGG
jgi:methylated-DNA-[protein]-cysteine S-methyltransferase